MEDSSEKFIRPDSLLEALGIGGNFTPLTKDERAAQSLIVEEHKKRGEVYLNQVKRYRESHPDSSLGEVVRALYKEIGEPGGEI